MMCLRVIGANARPCRCRLQAFLFSTSPSCCRTAGHLDAGRGRRRSGQDRAAGRRGDARLSALCGQRKPQHDLNYIGSTGLLAQQAETDPPVVPPALIADIVGGSFPAIINILLALRQHDQTGADCHLDIAMSDAMFTFAWHALATGAATGRYPEGGEGLLVGGSARYHLYRTRDRKLVAFAALEPKFWEAFCDAIGLRDALTDDLADPVATTAAVAALIAHRTAEEWRPVFAAANCCATIVLRWRRRCRIRSSGNADCLRGRCEQRRATSRPCRSQSRRNFAAGLDEVSVSLAAVLRAAACASQTHSIPANPVWY